MDGGSNRKLLGAVLTLLMVLGLTSCASPEKPEPQIETQEVKVGVTENIPDFTIPPKPELPIEDIDSASFSVTNENDLERLGKAYVISIHLLIEDNKKLRNLLQGIKDHSKNQQ